MITPRGAGGQLEPTGASGWKPRKIWLGIDSALADGVRHTVDGQHVRGDTVIHAMRFGVSDNVIEGRNHDFFQILVDHRFLPEVALAVLHPLEVRSSDTAGVG